MKQARADEIVAAYDAWVAECDATRAACGLTAAEEEADAAEGAEWELRQAALATPARTIEGLRAKAEVIALAADEMGTLTRLAERGDRMAGTIVALVRDLWAMGTSA